MKQGSVLALVLVDVIRFNVCPFSMRLIYLVAPQSQSGIITTEIPRRSVLIVSGMADFPDPVFAQTCITLPSFNEPS